MSKSKRTTTRQYPRLMNARNTLIKNLERAGFKYSRKNSKISPEFSLFVGGKLALTLKFNSRGDGTYHVKPVLPLWIIKEIHAAGYETKKKKPALRVVD